MHFGISASAAEHDLPLWEREMLLRRLAAYHEDDDAPAAPVGGRSSLDARSSGSGDLSVPPPDLGAL
jgi:hypothetical protein